MNSKTLTAEMKKTFPSIRKPEDYANVIQEGLRLGAVDRPSAKKRRQFLESGVVKDSIFALSYTKFVILISIRNAERNPVIHSARRGRYLYDIHDARALLDLENSLLLRHVNSDYHVKAIVLRSLKLPHSSASDAIRNKLSAGDVFHRATVYRKIFDDLSRNAIPRKGYMWAGVVTTPVSRYYLSPKAHGIITNVQGGDNV